jgi:hypothetical protein
MNFEVDVRGTDPVRACRVGAWLYGFNPVGAVMVGSNVDAADEMGIERCRIRVVAVRVTTEGVGLPDRDGDVAERFAVEIKNPSSDLDRVSLCGSVNSLDRRQIGLRGGRTPCREVRA